MRITGYRLYLTRRDPAHSIIYDYRVDGRPENLPTDDTERIEAINVLMSDRLLHSVSDIRMPLVEGWRELTNITIDLPDTTARNGNYIALDIEGVGVKYYFVTRLTTISSGKCSLQLSLDVWASYHRYLTRCRGAISRAHVDRYRYANNPLLPDTYYPILNPYDDPLTDGIAVHTTHIYPYHHYQLKDSSDEVLDDDTQIIWIYRKLNVNKCVVTRPPDEVTSELYIKGIDYFSTGLPVVATPAMIITNFTKPSLRMYFPITSVSLNGIITSDPTNASELGESSSAYINSWLSLIPPSAGDYRPTLIGDGVLLHLPSRGISILGAFVTNYADGTEMKLSPITIIEANRNSSLVETDVSIIDTIQNHSVTLSEIKNGEAPESKIYGMGYDEVGFLMGDMYCPFDYTRPNVSSTHWLTRYGEYPVSDIVTEDIDGTVEIVKSVGFMPTSALPSSVDQAELFLRSSGESYYLAKANAKRDAAIGIGGGILKGIGKALTGDIVGGVNTAVGATASGAIKLSDVERKHEAKMTDLGNAIDAITVPSRNSIEALSYNADILLKVKKSVDPESRDRITRTWRLKGYPVNLFGDVIRRNRKWFDYVVAIDLTPPTFYGFNPDEIPLASEFDQFAGAISRGVMILHVFTEIDDPRPGQRARALGNIAFDMATNPERSLI